MSPLEPAPNGYPIKLVRDRTPEIVNETGRPGSLFYGPVPEDVDHASLLRQKLGEEVVEYVEGHALTELLDVLAVVEGLGRILHGLKIEDLIRRMHDDPRGGFLDGVVMYGYHPEFDRPGAEGPPARIFDQEAEE